MDRRQQRRENGATKGGLEQQHEFVQMPYYPQLLADVSKGLESRVGDCRDQEESCFQWLSLESGRCFSDEWRRVEGERRQH
jgi:hypothetical protein